MGKWCWWRASDAYALRQLKLPLSNINRLAEQVSVSTDTFVILGVIPAITWEAYGRHYANLSGRKTPPVGNEKHDFKKGAKGSIGFYCCFSWLWFD